MTNWLQFTSTTKSLSVNCQMSYISRGVFANYFAHNNTKLFELRPAFGCRLTKLLIVLPVLQIICSTPQRNYSGGESPPGHQERSKFKEWSIPKKMFEVGGCLSKILFFSFLLFFLHIFGLFGIICLVLQGGWVGFRPKLTFVLLWTFPTGHFFKWSPKKFLVSAGQ